MGEGDPSKVRNFGLFACFFILVSLRGNLRREGGGSLAFWEVVDLADVPAPAAPLDLPFELRVVARCWDFCGLVDFFSSAGEFEEGGRHLSLAFWEVIVFVDAPTPVAPLDLPFELRVVTPCW